MQPNEYEMKRVADLLERLLRVAHRPNSSPFEQAMASAAGHAIAVAALAVGVRYDATPGTTMVSWSVQPTEEK